MPLTEKGKTIKSAMDKEYGKKKGNQVFYASENKGNIKGVAKKSKSTALDRMKEVRSRVSGSKSYM